MSSEVGSVDYLDAAQRERFRIFVHEGLLYGTNGRPVDTRGGNSLWGRGDGLAIFVMDEHGNLYASNGREVGKFHHSSFLAGGPVAGAGELRVIDGGLVFISGLSGHYRPTPGYLRRVVERLRAAGVEFDRVEFGPWGS